MTLADVAALTGSGDGLDTEATMRARLKMVAKCLLLYSHWFAAWEGGLTEALDKLKG